MCIASHRIVPAPPQGFEPRISGSTNRRPTFERGWNGSRGETRGGHASGKGTGCRRLAPSARPCGRSCPADLSDEERVPVQTPLPLRATPVGDRHAIRSAGLRAARAAGFEPAHTWAKTTRLTAWLHPSRNGGDRTRCLSLERAAPHPVRPRSHEGRGYVLRGRRLSRARVPVSLARFERATLATPSRCSTWLSHRLMCDHALLRSRSDLPSVSGSCGPPLCVQAQRSARQLTHLRRTVRRIARRRRSA